MPKLTGATPNEEIQPFPLALMVHIFLKIVQDTLCKKSREEHGLLTQYDLEFRNAIFFHSYFTSWVVVSKTILKRLSCFQSYRSDPCTVSYVQIPTFTININQMWVNIPFVPCILWVLIFCSVHFVHSPTRSFWKNRGVPLHSHLIRE